MLTNIRSPVLVLPERGPAGPPGASGAELQYPTRDSVPAETIGGGVDFFRVAGKTTVGDGHDVLYERAVSEPAHDGKIQSDDGAWWAVTPRSEFEIIDFEYFCRKYNDHRTRVIEAHKALFNETARIPMKLECHGIKCLTTEPILLRRVGAGVGDAVLEFGDEPEQADKIVSNLSITRTVGAYAWQTHDYVYSIAGEQDDLGDTNLRMFIMENCQIDVADGGQVGLHFSGYYHFLTRSLRIRGLAHADAIGWLSSKYAIESGYGNPGGVTDNANHGAAMIDQDIRGTEEADLGLGWLSEDGDLIMRGGWVSWLAQGGWHRRGGFNSEGVHYSLHESPTLRMKCAVRIDSPRVCSIGDDELDGCYYLFDNPTDNMFSEGVSNRGWTNIAIKGTKNGSARLPPVGQRGLFRFHTREVEAASELEPNYIVGLIIQPDWNTMTADAAGLGDVVEFETEDEFVTNGDFLTDTIWTKGTGFTISDGAAIAVAGSGSDLSQTFAVAPVAGEEYFLSFTIRDNPGLGTVTPKLTGGVTVTGTVRSNNSTFIEKLTVHAGGNTSLVFTKSADFAGRIEEVKFAKACWDGSLFGAVVFNPPHCFGVNPGKFPRGVKVQIARTDRGSVFLQDSKVLFGDKNNIVNKPYLHAVGQSLRMGRLGNSGASQNDWWDFTDGHMTQAGDGLAEIGSLARPISRVWADQFVLKDGVTAPPTTVGVAKIYVDVADGDLKIKYGDGVIKTIIVDT